MTRRSLFLFPLFAAAVQKLLPARFRPSRTRSTLSSVPGPREFLRNIGCPDGWVPFAFDAGFTEFMGPERRFMQPAYSKTGLVQSAVLIPLRPVTWEADARAEIRVRMLRVSLETIVGLSMKGQRAISILADFELRLNAAAAFVETEYQMRTPLRDQLWSGPSCLT